MLSFTPVFLIGTSYIILHEVPSFFGFLGICIIVSGSYVLNISAGHEHVLDPIQSMVRNRASWYMLVVAFLFAVSINFDKIVLLNSDPFFGMALTVLSIGIAFLFISAYSFMVKRNQNTDLAPNPSKKEEKQETPTFAVPQKQFVILTLLIGLFVAIEAASINVAYTLQIVPYVIAIKRLSIIFMVLYGTIVLAEGDITKRVMGATIMVLGAMIILLFA
jgi:drug/metabolite transporter (DMT)-like permease